MAEAAAAEYGAPANAEYGYGDMAADTVDPSAAGSLPLPRTQGEHQSNPLISPFRRKQDGLFSTEDCIKQTAAQVLKQLADDDKNKDAIREAGGLKRLVRLLSSPDVEVQLSALGALTSLALNDDNKNEIRELQAIPKIINLLDVDQNRDEVVVEKAVEVIWNLAGIDSNRASILYAGGVKKLLDLTNSPNPNIFSKALGAIANLCVHEEIHVTIRDTGGVELIVKMLMESNHTRTRERAANCLENLALDETNRSKIHELGGTRGLVKLLQGNADTLVRAAAGALKNLSVDDENKAEITKEDGLRALLELLSHPDPSVVDRAAECIGNFALDTTYRQRIKDMDGVVQLLGLLDNNHSDNVRLGAVAAMTLTNLAVQESSALAIANAGGVHLLIQCMGTPTDEILQEKAASALWNLSTVPAIKTQIRKAGAIPFLLSVLEFSSFVPAI